jgi:3-oxoacyl-[acyl-carrier-protein] synthase-3
MALFSIPHIRLSAIAAAVPSDEVSNDRLQGLDEPLREEFFRAVGIRKRRVAPPPVCASDLCVAAARKLFERSSIAPRDIGALVFVTQTPDYPLPGNGMLAQDRLGLPSSTYVLDVNQGCAGYVYGLASLASLMRSADIEKGLLLVGDTITRIVAPGDRSTLPIFSDAGSATLLERTPATTRMHFSLGSEGAEFEVIRVRGGGAREPFGPASLVPSEDEYGAARAPIHLEMRGIDVLHGAVKHVDSSIRELLAFAKIDLETPDYYVLHQASRTVNASILRRLGVPGTKAPETLSDYGNTSCATIPVTICCRLPETLAGRVQTLVLSGFGAGFSWGSALLTTDSVLCLPLFELEGSHGT